MIYKWILPGVLTCVTAIGMADVSYGQYQGYASSSQYESYAPNRAQLPQWNSASSATSQQPTTNQYTPASTTRPHAYSPSEMPSVNPFSNVRSQQQSAGNYGNASYQPTERFSSGPQYQPSTQYQPPTQYQPLTQYPTATQYQPASQPYNTYSASFGDQQHGAMGGGMAYSGANTTGRADSTSQFFLRSTCSELRLAFRFWMRPESRRMQRGPELGFALAGMAA